MLKERVLSAIVMIIAALGALFLLPPLPFTLVLSAVIVLGMWEWAQFVGFKSAISRAIVAFVAIGVLLFPIIAGSDQIRVAHFLTDETTPLLLMGCVWWFVAFWLVISFPHSAKWWAKSTVAKFLFGICTLVPFFLATLALRFYHYSISAYAGLWVLLYVFLLVWSADSGAYFFGRAFGKHKLAPKVSPGKSIEGALGGLFTAGVVAFVFLQLAPENVFGRELSFVPFLLVSVATVAISILGDLAESMFKRQAGVKDSSQLIPGHGGILDRIDSLCAAVPFFATFFFLVL